MLSMNAGNARLVAAMGPGVAVALADWLDDEAAHVTKLLPRIPLARPLTSALAVARAVLDGAA